MQEYEMRSRAVSIPEQMGRSRKRSEQRACERFV